MEEKIINIINEMAEYLRIEQLQKLQEVILRELAENAVKKEEISNKNYTTLFLNAKRMEGCSDRTVHYYQASITHFLLDMQIPVRKINTEAVRD